MDEHTCVIRDMAAGLLDVPAATVPLQTPCIGYGMNSLKLIMLLTQLENAFGIKFGERDLEDFGELSVAVLVRLVADKQASLE